MMKQNHPEDEPFYISFYHVLHSIMLHHVIITPCHIVGIAVKVHIKTHQVLRLRFRRLQVLVVASLGFLGSKLPKKDDSAYVM